MPLTTDEMSRTLYHLGYLGVATAPSLSFGMSRPVQTLFLVQTAVQNIQEAFVNRVRSILQVMDNLETKLIESQDRLAATRLDGLALRENEPELLEREYVRWGFRLADILACPVYAYSTRYRGYMGGGTGAGSIPVLR